MDQVDVKSKPEGLFYLLGFPGTKQTVVDEHAGQLIADRMVHQSGGYRRVDPSRQSANDLLRPHLAADSVHRLLDDRMVRPIGQDLADVEKETFHDLGPARRVRHLGVELHSVAAPLTMLHRRYRRPGC